MRRLMIVLFALAVVAAACGTEQTDTPVDDEPISTTTTDIAETGDESTPDTTAAPEAVVADEEPVPSISSAPPPPAVDGPPAPDFTIALADGSSFTLSAEEKPVYMVFWAEW